MGKWCAQTGTYATPDAGLVTESPHFTLFPFPLAFVFAQFPTIFPALVTPYSPHSS